MKKRGVATRPCPPSPAAMIFGICDLLMTRDYFAAAWTAGFYFSSVVLALVLFLVVRVGDATTTVGQPSLPAVDLGKLARKWEPELYDELGTNGAPAKFEDGYKSPCVYTADGTLRCVPGAYVLGGWQCGVRSLGQLLSTHPDLAPVGNDACFGQWRGDRGGRKWLTAALPKQFEPKRQLLAALGCVTGLQFYPGVAPRPLCT